MRLGIEAKWFFKGPPGGHTYARNFTEAMMRQEASPRVFLRRDDQAEESRYNWGGQGVARVRAMGKLLHDEPLVPAWEAHAGPGLDRVPQLCTVGRAGAQGGDHPRPLIFLSHPSEFTWKERLYFRGIRASARSADLIITVSDYVNRDVRERGFARPDQPVVTCPCAGSGHLSVLLARSTWRTCVGSSTCRRSTSCTWGA